ncbi:MAG: hypothetical protein WC777_03115 [Candidatus Gracilibacteria bacterium]|jgi:hypothetical protein
MSKWKLALVLSLLGLTLSISALNQKFEFFQRASEIILSEETPISETTEDESPTLLLLRKIFSSAMKF